MQQLVQTGSHRIALSGAIDFHNAVTIERDGWAMLSQFAHGDWCCDLAGLSSGSSVTAAVLMAWQGKALKRGARITLENIPARLQAILAASHLLTEFSVQDASV